MPTNPHHGYLTEPRWMTTSATVKEVTFIVPWRIPPSTRALFGVFGAYIAAVLVVIMIIAG